MKFFSLKDILHNTTQKGYQKSEKKKKKIAGTANNNKYK